MFNIKITPNYYHGTINALQEMLLRECDLPGGDETDCSQVNWELEEDAQEVIDALEAVTYCLSHGEAGRPTYKIIEDGNDGLPDCLPGGTTTMPGWDSIDACDIPRRQLRELNEANVDFDKSGEDYDVYSAEVEDDEGVQYKVVYCPRTIVLQQNSDDLGGINWDNQVYFTRRD
jgi:hypothetical protein